MIVVDCSLVVDALTQRDLTEARARLAARRLHAPTLIDYEVASALRGLVLAHALSAPRAQDALADYLDLGVRRHPPTRALLTQAWELRDRMTAHDASYVVLARALGASLWTLDKRLARAASGVVDVCVP